MNYAVLYDLNALNVACSVFEHALKQLDGKPVYIKLYGYNSKRNRDYTPFVREHSAHVAVPMANRKKVRIDIRQVIDAVRLSCQQPSIDAFFILCAPIEAQPMLQALREAGKRVVLGILSPNGLESACDQVIVLDRTAGLPPQSTPKTTDSVQVAAEQDERFLPFTDVYGRPAQMRRVSNALQDMIVESAQRKAASGTDRDPSQATDTDIESLMKKYF